MKTEDSVQQRRKNDAIDEGWDVHHAMRRLKNAGILGMICIIRKCNKSTTYQLIVKIMFWKMVTLSETND